MCGTDEDIGGGEVVDDLLARNVTLKPDLRSGAALLRAGLQRDTLSRSDFEYSESEKQGAERQNVNQPRCSFSIRAVATRASNEQISTIVTSTSAPAHAWRCQSSYGAIA